MLQRLRQKRLHSQRPRQPTCLCGFPAKSPAIKVASTPPQRRGVCLQFGSRGFAANLGWSERVGQMRVKHA